MPLSPRRPASLQGRVFRGSRVVAQGLLTRTELRSAAWRPLFRDVYADARLAVTHRTRCTAAALWVLPPGAAIAGRSAAALYGAASVANHEPIDVLVPAGKRFGPVSGLVVHTGAIAATDVAVRQGIPLTTPTRICWDLAQWLPTEDAVAVVDRLASQRLVTLPRLRAASRARIGDRGWKRMVRVAELADAGAESIPESQLRVRIVLAGVPAPVTQFVVERDGRFVPVSIWRGRTSRSPSSTTGCGTTIPSSSTETAAASTDCSVRTGSSCTSPRSGSAKTSTASSPNFVKPSGPAPADSA
ncbi:hypothetical protein ACLQ3D_07510 [Micromonospora vinacea]|uniref:DUF559 domain-containing protein n=1 Tax=Micromonospora vinacea TaxID=709878 RepID=UPI003CF3F1BF